MGWMIEVVLEGGDWSREGKSDGELVMVSGAVLQ